jgi:hypothetical protein
VGNCDCVHYLRYTGRRTGDILCRCSNLARCHEAGQINDVVQRLHIDLRPNFRVLIEPRLHVSGDLSVARTLVPNTLHDVDFMVKDSKKFADTGGWGYAVFEYDVTAAAYRPGNSEDHPPQENNAKCGAACHTIAAK